jgi:hypothetical protein
MREGGRTLVFLRARPDRIETGMPERGMASAEEKAAAARKLADVVATARPTPGRLEVGAGGGAAVEKGIFEGMVRSDGRRSRGCRRRASRDENMEAGGGGGGGLIFV